MVYKIVTDSNFNNAMKQDLPRFMMLATQFIDPLYNSFYYMQ